MAEILVRQAVSADIELLSRFEHSIKTDCVWQMSQKADSGKVTTIFTEIQLPREMRLGYPKSPDTLLDRWKFYSSVLVACINKVPVGYVTFNGAFSQEILWVKDLVVNELYRNKGVATALIQAATAWGTARRYSKLTIEMSSKNYPCINLVRKCGFEYAGFNDNYFNNNDIALFFTRFIK